jgi:hypothetical protein
METTTAALDSNGDIKQMHIQQTEIRTTIRDASICWIFRKLGHAAGIIGSCLEMVSSHAVYLRNQICGGKTPVQFRRFSSSKPTRLAEGLGPIRLPPAVRRCAPKTWVPRSRSFPRLGFRLGLCLSYCVVVVNIFLRSK